MAYIGAPNFAARNAIYTKQSLRRINGVFLPKKLPFLPLPNYNLLRTRTRTNLQSKASTKDEVSPSNVKGLLQSEELYQYVLETSVYPREPESLKEIRAITANHPEFYMGATPDSGQLIAMLLNLINAKRTIEIGVFTGYSVLLTALTIPDDGKIIAIDPDLKSYELGLPVIQKAGVEHKIDFKDSPALPVLDKLLEDIRKKSTLNLKLCRVCFNAIFFPDSLQNENRDKFDFAFVDADKTNYGNYHERLMQLVKVGGMIVYDNTLWYGTVVMPEENVYELMRAQRKYVLELNRFLAADTRIQISQVTVGDGMTICRRLF